MATKQFSAPPAKEQSNGLLRKAVNALRATNWMSPTSSLASSGSTVFGRSIESKLLEVSAGHVMRLRLRKKDAAVVMSVERYEELLEMKNLYSQLMERIQEDNSASATDEYEELYQRITSSQSRKAANALFGASEEDLSATFKPGRTEAT